MSQRRQVKRINRTREWDGVTGIRMGEEEPKLEIREHLLL